MYLFYLAPTLLGSTHLPQVHTLPPLNPLSPLDLISDVLSLAFAIAHALALSPYSLSFAMSGTGGWFH